MCSCVISAQSLSHRHRPTRTTLEKHNVLNNKQCGYEHTNVHAHTHTYTTPHENKHARSQTRAVARLMLCGPTEQILLYWNLTPPVRL